MQFKIHFYTSEFFFHQFFISFIREALSMKGSRRRLTKKQARASKQAKQLVNVPKQTAVTIAPEKIAYIEDTIPVISDIEERVVTALLHSQLF